MCLFLYYAHALSASIIKFCLGVIGKSVNIPCLLCPMHGWNCNGFAYSINSILTGGGVNLSPLHEIRDCVATAADRDTLFHDFLSFKSYASFDTKFAKIGPSVARSRNFLYSHVGSKFAQNPHFAYVQNTWKLLIFLKCSKSVFILSFWPFAQFLISWN